MPRVITNKRLESLSGELEYWAYNALDCCVTAEVFDNIRPQLDDNAQLIYSFERASQRPALTMQMRGINIDLHARDKGIETITAEAEEIRKGEVDAIAEKYLEKPFNEGKNWAPSYQQTGIVLYDKIGVPVQRNNDGKRSTNRDCLKRVSKKYSRKFPDGARLADLVLSLRDYDEQRKMLTRGVSDDGRMRCSFNVGATETGRWSSSSDPFGQGGNVQNVTHRLRNIFIPDPGYTMFYADLEQAESRCIAYLARDDAYIKAHLSGNVHVMAGYIFWPNEIDWKDDLEVDKKLMKYTPAWWIPQPDPEPGEQPAFSVYDMSKRGQHGLNYLLKPQGLSIWLGCKKKDAEVYYDNYFTAYPGIPQYHGWVRSELKRTGSLTTPLGRRRQFLGRYWDNSTIREAVAHVPQSMTGDILNIGLNRVWEQLDPDPVQVLANCHDAILGQIRNEALDEYLPKVVELMRVDVPVHNQIMTIPVDVGVGPNWRDIS